MLIRSGLRNCIDGANWMSCWGRCEAIREGHRKTPLASDLEKAEQESSMDATRFLFWSPQGACIYSKLSLMLEGGDGSFAFRLLVFTFSMCICKEFVLSRWKMHTGKQSMEQVAHEKVSESYTCISLCCCLYLVQNTENKSQVTVFILGGRCEPAPLNIIL